MSIFEKRINELYELLGRRVNQNTIRSFREIYFIHLTELTPYKDINDLEPFIREYKYLLYHAVRTYRHDNIGEAKMYLGKALELSKNIAL